MDLQKIFHGIKEKMLIDFEEISSEIGHNLSKGQVRECEIVNEFLSKYIPGNIGIAHGEIITCDGKVSPETDIILHEKLSTPYLLKKENYQIVPIECVYLIIEVKSNLNTSELKDSFKKINTIKQMSKLAYHNQPKPLIRSTNLYEKNWGYFPVIGMVVSYSSINLRSLKETLISLHTDVPLEHRIDSVWVLDKGMIVNMSSTFDMTPSRKSELIVISSDNPLLALTVQLQSLLLSAWMPKFDLNRYFGDIEYGVVSG